MARALRCADMAKAVQQEPKLASPEDYANLFESTPRGKLVFDSLIRRFNRPPCYEGGIDGIRKSDFRAGARAVIDFIVNQINRNNGVAEAEPEGEP
jgi:hypothetical protein